MANTVRITPIDDHNALLMEWDVRPNPADVRAAFEDIRTAMNQYDHPIYVVVDLPDNVQFPVSDTVLGALPVYRDEQLEAWLVINPGGLAKSIARTLNYITRRKNVYWFDTYAEAMRYLAVYDRSGAAAGPEDQ